jgi:hypothetical protein
LLGVTATELFEDTLSSQITDTLPPPAGSAMSRLDLCAVVAAA